MEPAFSWAWHPHLEVLAGLVTLGMLYIWAVRNVGPSRVAPGEQVLTKVQKRSAIAAGITLLVAAEWPIHDLAEGYLYSVHMVQHILLSLVFAPLALRALPAWMVRALVPRPALRVVRALSRPLIALAIFNLMLVFTHWPLIVNTTARSEWLHLGVHILLVASALIMWMPVFSPLLEIPRLSYPMQTMYLFLQSLVPTVPASFLTFGSRPLYSVYERFPTPFGFSDLADQRTAGLIMKIIGGAILFMVIGSLYYKWYRLERNEGVDALAWQDVDRSLDREFDRSKA